MNLCGALSEDDDDDASSCSFAHKQYLDLHIAEQRPTVQQPVVLPAPAHLPHVALPGHRRLGAGCSSAQITEVSCGLRWRRALTDVPGEIIWSRPVVSDSIWTLTDTGDIKRRHLNTLLRKCSWVFGHMTETDNNMGIDNVMLRPVWGNLRITLFPTPQDVQCQDSQTISIYFYNMNGKKTQTDRKLRCIKQVHFKFTKS